MITGDSVFFMSHSIPQLGKTNIDMLQEQIKGLQPHLTEHRTLDFIAGFIMGKTMSIEAIQRMWGAAEIIATIDPETHLTVEEMREITYTLKTIADTLEPR